MKRTVLATLALTSLFSLSSLAGIKSDYDHHYKLTGAKTWDFKQEQNTVKDATGNNSLWEQRVRDDIKQQLTWAGFTKTQNAAPGLLVSYHLNTSERMQTQYLRSSSPGFFGYYGRRYRGFGWQPGWNETTIVRSPNLKSTVVMDVIDASTNQLVWRGYDTEAIDFGKSEQNINQSVQNLTKRFQHDLKLK